MCVCVCAWRQIGFLTEWQTYAQKIEGDEWIGEKIDKAKLDKLSGELRRHDSFGIFQYKQSIALCSHLDRRWLI